jgi:dolichyl-diphosphooligosaccharide--protein glycosyltransferase/undecaprenyl-diphosphooligosaccharide--protein glycosyltransferase
MSISENKRVILLILIAFVFSFSVRLIWVEQFSTNEQFKFNNEFMINTNDGYYYAEGARDILAGVTENTNDLSPFESAGAILTAIVAKIVPFSFETVILYMPAFFASLIVIPMILIGKSLGKLELGFIAALLASIAWSYYNRTMVGYYDTDLLNIVFPTILLWSLIWAIRTKEDKYLIITALDMIAYRWWYPQSYSLEFAMIGLISLYVLYQYIKKEDYQFNLFLVTFMMFAMMNLDGYIRLIIVIVLFGLLKVKRELVSHYIYYIFGVAVSLFLINGGFNPIISQLKGYVFRDIVSAVTDGLQVHFFAVAQTVREANAIPFETFANRISGHTITFLLSVAGYIWLSIRYPIMLLGLPMIGLGFLAYKSGLRFTIYAVPILAFGMAFIITQIADMIKNNYGKYIFMILATFTILAPNIQHIIDYKVPTVFTKNEVVNLDKLKSIVDREDYVVGWWDYGYPIRYYSDVKTLVDGGKHSGAVNFPVSYALTETQSESAKMMRLDVEYTEKRFAINKHNEDLDKDDPQYIKWEPSNIAQMTLDYGYKDTNDFLTALETDIELPKKTRDIYIYLPNRMMNIYPTVKLFSNIDLMTGVKGNPPFFYKTTQFKEHKDSIDLGRGIKLSKKDGKLALGNKSVSISRFVKTAYDNKGKLKTNIQNIDLRSNYSVIFMQNYNQFLVVDEQTYQSLYFQLFVLENYDKELFEPTILTPLAKIYKLKI